MSLARDLREALDPVALARRCGLTPDPWQAEVLRSADPNLALCCARQVGKTTVVAYKAMHVALYQPGSLVLIVAPSQRQSGELFRSALALYRKLGRPVSADAENMTSLALENGSRIVSLPGDERTIRGYASPRLVIVDEAAWVVDELLVAVRPMLAVSGGQLIALSTPFGKRGWFHEAVTAPGTPWRVVKVPATDCPRISEQTLEFARTEMGDWRFRQEYMCEFVDATSGYFNAEDIAGMFDDELTQIGPDTLPALRLLKAAAS